MYIWEYWFWDNFKVLIIRLWWFWSLLSKASPKSISKVFQCGSLKISKIWTIFIFGHCFTKGSTFGFQKLWLHILAVSWTKSRLLSARLKDHLHHLIIDDSVLAIFKDRKVLLWITLVLTYVRTYVRTYKSSSVEVILH